MGIKQLSFDLWNPIEVNKEKRVFWDDYPVICMDCSDFHRIDTPLIYGDNDEWHCLIHGYGVLGLVDKEVNPSYHEYVEVGEDGSEVVR